MSMDKSYIHLFNSVAEYEEARKNNYYEPWVSYTEGIGGGLAYDKTEHEKLLEEPLTFKIISAGTIVWKAYDDADYMTTIEYSTDSGETWTSITAATDGTSFSVNAGDTVQFRGNNATYYFNGIYNTFSGSTARFEVEGNIMSLIDSANFATATTLASSDTFYSLFNHCTGLISAENLILPATTLADGCYYGMFGGCTNLNYIKCLATDISASDCTSNWVYGVASSTGTFVKPSTADWSSKTGNDGIPSNWTVQDA